ncbi:MAG: anti-sigma factor family protein [Planctomycetota bacterium]|jgi:hypothetical protein
MTEPQENNPSDEQLWGRVAHGPPDSPTACPSPLELAAFIDGRASEAQRQALESHLADCPACLEAVAEIRSVQTEAGDSSVLVPATLLESAKGLVTERKRTRRSLVLADWRLIGRWSAAAAASIVMGLAGYHAGVKTLMIRQDWTGQHTSEMSFGVLGPGEQGEPEFELFALTGEEVSP